MGIIEDELADVKAKCEFQIEGSKLISCVSSMIQVSIEKTKHKQLTACIQYPKNYPSQELICELKSKTLSEKFLAYLTKACERECQKYLGSPQVLRLLRFLKNFLEENPLCICSQEISSINKMLGNCDEMKLKQKSSSIVFRICKEQYFTKLRVYLPDNYPEKQIELDFTDCNFPDNFKRWFLGQSAEIARQCVEKPSKQKQKSLPFQPRPSLEPVMKFLIDEIKRCPTEFCHLCKSKCFPDNPKDYECNGQLKFIERAYCGHIFHYSCLDQYMKTPPFSGGKKCPECKKVIYHNKWKTTHKIAEERWAHHEAKKRELGEVVEFFD